MTRVTLPAITATDRQSFITALNGYLVPDYFDAVQYENGTDGTTFASIDEGAARVAVYLKDGVRALAIDMYYSAGPNNSPRPTLGIAGASGIGVSMGSGLSIALNPSVNSLVVDTNHLWLGILDAATGKITGSTQYWPQILFEKGANGTVNASRVDINTTSSYYMKFFCIAVGRSATNTMQEIPVSIAKASAAQATRAKVNTYTELMRLFTEDAEDSVLLNTYLILTASSVDMSAIGTMTLNGTTYRVIGPLAYTE